MGAGSVGTLLGARLTQAGLAVDLIDVNREHVDALNAAGAHVTGTIDLSVPVSALTPDQLDKTYDLVFLLVKQTHNTAAFAQLEGHLNDRGVICTLQNGIPELAVAAAFGEERTMGCAVTWGATFLGPGRIEATTAQESWHSSLGTVSGTVTAEAEEVRSVLSHMCPTQLVTDLMGIRWSKLLVNCSFSGMSAALGCTFGEILDDARALKCAQYIARECIRVSEAQGIKMAPLSPGEDFKVLMDFDTEAERLATSWIYRKLWGAAAAGKASMLQDLENGRKTEIAFINGLLSDLGRKYGVPTPVSDTVVRIVEGIEAGLYRPRLENLDLFDLVTPGPPVS